MTVFIALLPILCIFLFLFLFKLTSCRAGILSFLVTILITLSYPRFQLAPEHILHSSSKGLLISLIAAYVLFFGIFLFHLMNSAGSIQSIAAFISQATSDRILQVLMIIIGLSPLIESTSGFGIAFMIVVPIFIALGFSPMKSALLGLVSLLAVPWGALATGTVIGAELGGLSLQKLGTGSAILSIPAFVYFTLVAVYIAGGIDAIKAKWNVLLLLSFTFSISILFFNAFVSVELAGVLSSLLTTGMGIVLIKVSSFKNKRAELATSIESGNSILKVVSPYIILTGFIFISRLWTPVRQFLESHIVLSLPSFSFSMALLYSPGFWLFVTCLFTICIFKIQKAVVVLSLQKTLKQWIPFTISTLAFVSISEVMATAGMTQLLSDTTGALLGTSFLLISPLIGGIGGYLTGSNTGSNAMFIQLQMQTAGQVGLSPELIAMSQNASSSHSTMACPSRVMLGASLCNVQTEENRLLKRITLIVLGAILIIGVSLLVFSLTLNE
ncbi:L-lactate permease [Sporosarcina sp. Te-1]|uniref:L-lactate permease n=1 Tax=Sporosarcina sp. Te-1 TaxID=2818390 RepID=UPI001A9E88F3|nr:L-lactate permease [Sporosarcina sp. Te-1]QTD40314.1 L-lactate permease [Sporosarcina sp. Te-1]